MFELLIFCCENDLSIKLLLLSIVILLNLLLFVLKQKLHLFINLLLILNWGLKLSLFHLNSLKIRGCIQWLLSIEVSITKHFIIVFNILPFALVEELFILLVFCLLGNWKTLFVLLKIFIMFQNFSFFFINLQKFCSVRLLNFVKLQSLIRCSFLSLQSINLLLKDSLVLLNLSFLNHWMNKILINFSRDRFWSLVKLFYKLHFLINDCSFSGCFFLLLVLHILVLLKLFLVCH